MLPNVKWYMGQKLLPDHFDLMQKSISVGSFNILSSCNSQMHGITKLNIEPMFLKMGILRLTELQLYTIEGGLIDLDVNAKYVDLELNDLGENKLDIYINIFENEFDYEFNKSCVRCKGYIIKPSIEADLTSSYHIKLIELEKEVNKGWITSVKYLPPLLNMNLTICAELLNSLKECHKKIISSYEKMHKDSDFIQKAKDFQTILTSAYELKFCIENILFGNNCHPYEIYKLIYKIYIKITIFFNVDVSDISAYEHNNIYDNFKHILNKIDEFICHKTQNANFVRFELNENYYLAANLEDKTLYANNLFLVVQKRNKEQPFEIDELKLASPARYQIIDKLALTGLKKTKVVKVPFEHYFNDNCLFYKLSLGNEWDYVIKDKAISFKNKTNEFKDMKFYLYYY